MQLNLAVLTGLSLVGDTHNLRPRTLLPVDLESSFLIARMRVVTDGERICTPSDLCKAILSLFDVYCAMLTSSGAKAPRT